jgi:hypothetical protein
MPQENPPGEMPDVPPEYAEAYRRGYERAYREAAAADEGGPGPAEETQRLDSLEDVLGFPDLDRDPGPRRGPAHRDRDAGARPGWLVPAILVGLLVLLLVAAYVVGRAFSSSVGGSHAGEQTQNGIVISENGSTGVQPSPTQKQTKERPKHNNHKPAAKAYHGATEIAAIGGAAASCEAPGSADAAGHPVTYSPSNLYDGDMSTAWRCDGDGVGQRVTIELAQTTKIGEVGLVPGYAKTDPRSGVDRYAENDRITKVRWTFSDGTAVEQTLDGSPDNRDLQSIRIPVTTADQAVIEVLASTPGSRNTVAISEVRIGKVAD